MKKYRILSLLLALLLLFPAVSHAGVKGFAIDGNVGTAPLEVNVTVETTEDIRGIKVMDENGRNIPTGIVQTQSSGGKTWQLTATVNEACEAEWTVYLKSGQGKWTASDVSFFVSVSGNAAPAPKATPKPTPKATDASLSVSAPDACQLEESTRGIMIRIPPVSTTKTIASYDLYRIDETNAPWQARLIKSLSPSNLTYLDNNVSNGSSYSYYYVVVLKNGQNYPDSAVRSMKWTKGSSISNLRVWQDSNNIRRIHADWDDVVDAEYDVDIRINAYGNKSLKWHWSGLPYNTSDMFFRDAIPNTQYLVTVTEPISGKSLSQTIYLPKAPTYSRYGARPQGGTVTWVSHADEQAAANVYRANFTYYQTLSSSEFNNKSKDSGLYYRSKWIYSKSSSNHELDAMIVLRSPSGKVVWEEWFGQELSAVNGSSTWEWVYPLDYLISEMKDWKSNNLLEPGEYTVEHYYDDMLVNSSTFIIR